VKFAAAPSDVAFFSRKTQEIPMTEPTPDSISLPQFQFAKLRDPVKRLALMLAIHSKTWAEFAQLDGKVAALMLGEAGLEDPIDFRDAYSQLCNLVESRNTMMLARAKGEGDAGSH
jgi:hypothetical protein